MGINLAFCNRITDAGLVHLQKMAQLQKLAIIESPKITDAGVEHLKTLTQLRELSICGCPKVTDKSIPCLKRFTRLEKLFLFESNITAKGRSELKEALPFCSVF